MTPALDRLRAARVGPPGMALAALRERRTVKELGAWTKAFTRRPTPEKWHDALFVAEVERLVRLMERELTTNTNRGDQT